MKLSLLIEELLNEKKKLAEQFFYIAVPHKDVNSVLRNGLSAGAVVTRSERRIRDIANLMRIKHSSRISVLRIDPHTLPTFKKSDFESEDFEYKQKGVKKYLRPIPANSFTGSVAFVV